MKFDAIDVAQLLSDESFINYCKKSSPEDVAFWEKYIRENPDRALVDYANEKFVEIFNALAEADIDEQQMKLKNRLNLLEESAIVQEKGFINKRSGKTLSLVLKLSAAAAVVLAVSLFTIDYYNTGNNKSSKTFVAAYGERKNIQLPDGSDVTLNAGSKIEIDESFGVAYRNVYLEGEAFFDVKHNTKVPFIVHTLAMDVKALGTAFNVKAYMNEEITETSLIKGLVEITLKESNNRIMVLYPNQKIKWEHPLAKANSNKSPLKNGTLSIQGSLMQNLVVSDNGDIKETAWRENKLIFEDESFRDIAILLERWYGAKIEFKDETIQDYRFTGIFEKEDLKTVLDFLKESRSFQYKIEPGERTKIILSK